MNVLNKLVDKGNTVLIIEHNMDVIKTVDHIKDAFKPLFKTNPDLVVDGELYNHQFKDNFNKIISLVRKQKPNAQEIDEATRYIQFHWYDYYSDIHNYPFKIRHENINHMPQYGAHY